MIFLWGHGSDVSNKEKLPLEINFKTKTANEQRCKFWEKQLFFTYFPRFSNTSIRWTMGSQSLHQVSRANMDNQLF